MSLVLDQRTLNLVPLPNGEQRGNCPFCGDRKGHLYINAEKRVFYCFKCGASGRLSQDTLPVFRPVRPRSDQTSVTEHKRVPLRKLDDAYSALLAHLSLSPRHLAHLTSPARGFPPLEAQRRYRTLPRGDRAAVAEAVASWVDIEGVPGFYLRDGRWALAGPSGILIPVRNWARQIWGIQIRVDDPRPETGKYVWLSSAGKPDGTPARARYHVAYPDSECKTHRVWVTEGPLKADICARLLGEVVVAVPGVNTWKSTRVIDVVKAFQSSRAREVVLAFDSDLRTNPNVARALENLAQALSGLIRTWVAAWSGPKGLDDLLLAGGEPRLFRPEAFFSNLSHASCDSLAAPVQ